MLHINRLHCVALPDFRAVSFKHANYGNTLLANGSRYLDWNNNNRYSKFDVVICQLKIKGTVAFVLNFYDFFLKLLD